MIFEVKDLQTGITYSINGNQIAYFCKELNPAGVSVYFIVMSTNLKIAVTAKRWRRIKFLLNK